jgi:Icc-related predicted phosphoesterase
MNIQILSDVHIEFHMDYGRSFIDALNPDGVDVLVIAGDLGVVNPVCGPKSQLFDALKRLCGKFPHVVYVLGNHEFYNNTYTSVHSRFCFFSDTVLNLHWLNNDSVKIDGVKFSGSTLWCSPDPYNALYEHMVNDYLVIKDFREWVYEQNAIAQTFLSKRVDSDVIVTHYLPSPSSIHERFKDSRLNRFFLCNMERHIGSQKLWIHGHTHESFNYMLGNTRILCNPLGYVGTDLNQNYIEKLVVSV